MVPEMIVITTHVYSGWPFDASFGDSIATFFVSWFTLNKAVIGLA